MGFIRPNAVAIPGDSDNARRNRLSKPPTNKSHTNLQALAAPQLSSKNKSQTNSDVSLPSSPYKTDAKGYPDLSATCSKSSDLSQNVSYGGKVSAVALMVSRFEAGQNSANASSTSLSLSTRSKRPLSALFNSRRSSGVQTPITALSSSKESLVPLGTSEPLTGSPSSSLDRIVEDPAPRPRRSASCKPGVPRRKPVPSQSSPEQGLPLSFERDANVDTSLSSGIQGTETASEDDWTLPLPPQIIRADTPSDLGYSHLGGLDLGSLHIVNGRASPAFSEMSKQLKAQIPLHVRRDISSDYGDVVDNLDEGTTNEQWEDAEVASEALEDDVLTPQPLSVELERIFSFEYGTESQLSKIETPNVGQSHAMEYTPTPSHSDVREHTMTPTHSNVRENIMTPTHSNVRVDTMTPTRYDQTSDLAQQYMDELPQSPYHSVKRTPSTGSVRRYIEKMDSVRSFEDPALHFNPDDRSTSVESWYTSIEPRTFEEEAFASAVEIQPMNIPEETCDPLPERRSAMGDSGYGSSMSLPGLEQKTRLTTEIPQHKPEAEPPITPIKSRFGRSFFKNEPKQAGKSTVNTPLTPDTTIPAPASRVAIMDQSSPAHSLQKSTVKKQLDDVAKEPKSRKKLQKGRRKSMVAVPPEQIVVQSATAHESYDVPPVSTEIMMNLDNHLQALPELERTFKSHNHIKNQASISVLSFHVQEVRFPSPEPAKLEEIERPRSRSRSLSRSRSRRRSWFGGKKDDASQKRQSFNGQIESSAMIDDFGDVMSSLGTNPYDIANHKRTPAGDSMRPRMNPSDVSTKAPRPRSMMDDRTAAELARHRSKDDWSSRKPSFNDRGGIPGKNMRPTSAFIEAPPIPPMLSRAEIQRRESWRQSRTTSSLGSPQVDQYQWAPQSPPQPDRSPPSPPPPPPPRHSPRPAYVEHEVVGWTGSDKIAPPPPSHSPAPMDVASTQEDVWAAQARAWRARRQSAGEMLKSCDILPSHEHDWYQYEAISDEPIYPDIPPRRGRTYHEQVSRTHHEDRMWHDNRSANQYDTSHDQTSWRPSVQYRSTPKPSLYSNEDVSSRQVDREIGAYWPHAHSRPHSRHSYNSSLAEELHPSDRDQRPQPPPDFGRYSGGLEYGYEGRQNGFGGSAGFRSVSGKADAKRVSGGDMNDYGVDFSDVPIMGVPVGATGGRMRYA